MNDYLSLVAYFDSVGGSHQWNCLYECTPLEYNVIVSSVGHYLGSTQTDDLDVLGKRVLASLHY